MQKETNLPTSSYFRPGSAGQVLQTYIPKARAMEVLRCPRKTQNSRHCQRLALQVDLLNLTNTEVQALALTHEEKTVGALTCGKGTS